MILLLESNPDGLDVIKIAELMNYDKLFVLSELNAMIYNLAFNKTKTKTGGIFIGDEEEGKEITEKNVFKLNKAFTSQSLKVQTIPTVYKKAAGEDENAAKLEAANEKTYRNMIVDSNLTRIMKGRIGQKTTHTLLVQEVAKQIELFQAQPPQIKERIECLIEKNILKRNDGDRTCYDYVA